MNRRSVLYVHVVNEDVKFYLVNDLQTASFTLSLEEARQLATNISVALENNE